MARAARKPTHLQAIGERIAIAREALGLSQMDVCRAIGVGKTTWNNWERGERKPDALALIRFANTWGITLDWIFRADMTGLPHHVATRILQYKAGDR